jgi:hypothetical protein
MLHSSSSISVTGTTRWSASIGRENACQVTTFPFR